MTLYEIVLIVGTFIATISVAVALPVQGVPRRRGIAGKQYRLPAVLLLLAVGGLISLRSMQFGADSVVYAEIFDTYCRAGRLSAYDWSFEATAFVLNLGMFGACDSNWLAMSWFSIVLICLLSISESLDFRIRYAALLLFSFVGIELLTNALRQGLSIGLVLVAISYFRSSRILAVGAAVGAVVLHQSSMLVFVAFALAHLRPKAFVLALLSLVGAMAFILNVGIEVAPLNRFIYEIRKYSAHDGSEIWVRLLAALSLVTCVAWTAVTRYRTRRSREDVVVDENLGMAIAIAVTCVPFIFLPYFGYRYIYGVYPVILYFCSKSASLSVNGSGLQFVGQFLVNCIVLLVWSYGSVHMRNLPFLAAVAN